MTFAQADTCDCQKNKPVVLPVVLIGIGSINYLDGSLDKGIRSWRNEHYPTFRTHVDDYILYAPLLATYGLNLAGVKGKHDYKTLTIYAATSYLASTVIVHGLKNTVKRERPDASNRRSFPSGHSYSAFCFATIFHKEYGKKSKWYSVAGYSVATATGMMRMMNNKHWFSDVCVGAGIGILSTELTYRIFDKYQTKQRQKQKKSFFEKKF
jgi:membrane-associated phospholipid phosphatase